MPEGVNGNWFNGPNAPYENANLLIVKVCPKMIAVARFFTGEKSAAFAYRLTFIDKKCIIKKSKAINMASIQRLRVSSELRIRHQVLG